MNDLVKYDAACRAVAEAASIDEAKEFRDQSEALRAYARQAKNKQMETQAAEIRFRAERRIGELMAAQREGGHMATAGRPSQEIGSRTNPISKAPTLEEVGIDKKTADRARKYAAIPEEEFNGIVGQWRERVEAENARVTVDLLAAGQKAQKARTEPEPQIEEPCPAPDPYGYAKLTEEAWLDLANGLRADLDDEKAAHKKTKAERDQLKEINAELSADDKNAVAARYESKLRSVRQQRKTANDKFAAEKNKTYALKREAEEREKRIKELERQLEQQEIAL